MKIRINDLARELEVKSKAILDVLEEIGVAEKKTHSSSIEDDEAEKVRRHFSAKSSPAFREKAGPSEIKPKLDLSKISKPGDVFKLLKEREQQQQRPVVPPKPAAAPPAQATAVPPAAAKPAVPVAPPPPVEKSAVVAPKPAPAEKTIVVAPPVAKPVAPQVVAPVAPPSPEKPASPPPPPAVIVTPPAHPPAAATPAKPPAAPAPAATTPPAAAPQTQAPPAPPAKPPSQQPIVPQRRIITPQTGPRPVYQAPVQERPRPVPAPASGRSGRTRFTATVYPARRPAPRSSSHKRRPHRFSAASGNGWDRCAASRSSCETCGTPRGSRPPSRPTLPDRSQRGTHEGLCAAAAAGPFQRAVAGYTRHHHY